MKSAAGILGISFMLFVAKLGTMLGPSLPKIFDAGLSLAFQEVGHVIGTIVIGLPIALLIGMKREAIGATFSIDREPNLAIISENMGPILRREEGIRCLHLWNCIWSNLSGHARRIFRESWYFSPDFFGNGCWSRLRKYDGGGVRGISSDIPE